ncbi:MAG: hypothetical protein R3F56_24615 [Planctomycetota bacterium]
MNIFLPTFLLTASAVLAQAPTTFHGYGGDRFGHAIRTGDFNGDGYRDLAIGAPHETGGNRVDVYFGPTPLPTGGSVHHWAVDVVIRGPAGSECGWSLAVGDVLGGHGDDLIVGEPSTGGRQGAVHVFAGPLRRGTYDTTTDATLTIHGHANGHAGWSVAAGDFDGDGDEELAIGACAVGTGARTGFGEAYLLDLRRPMLRPVTTQDGVLFEGVGLTGCAVAALGDVNGDGYEDLGIGSYGARITSGYGYGGTAHVVYGRPSFKSRYVLTAPELTGIANLNASAEWQNVGFAIEPVGDVNQDGYADFMVGAPAYSLQTGASSAYLVLGSRDDASGRPHLFGAQRIDKVADVIFHERNSGDRIGIAVAGGMLVPRLPVLLVGSAAGSAWAFDYQPPPPSGGVTIGRRLQVSLAGHPRLVEVPGPAGAALGRSLAAFADLDGDGRNDTILGAPHQIDFTDPAGDGEVWVYRGR